MKRLGFLALAGSLMVSACTTTPMGTSSYNQVGPKQGIGTLAGAAVGGLLGNQIGEGRGKTAATIAGVVLGGLIGNQLGAGLDAVDQQRAANAEYTALEYGQTGSATTWRNPDTGHYGEVVPGAVANNCRDYTHTIYIDGQAQLAKGRACRASDGTWRVVS